MYFFYKFDFVELYLFFIARMFSFIGISSFKKLSSSLTPSRYNIYLSLSSFNSYSRYLIYYWRPLMYYSYSIFWLGLFFRFVIVCSKFFLCGPDLMRSCPSIFLADPLHYYICTWNGSRRLVQLWTIENFACRNWNFYIWLIQWLSRFPHLIQFNSSYI